MGMAVADERSLVGASRRRRASREHDAGDQACCSRRDDGWSVACRLHCARPGRFLGASRSMVALTHDSPTPPHTQHRARRPLPGRPVCQPVARRLQVRRRGTRRPLAKQRETMGQGHGRAPCLDHWGPVRLELISGHAVWTFGRRRFGAACGARLIPVRAAVTASAGEGTGVGLCRPPLLSTEHAHLRRPPPTRQQQSTTLITDAFGIQQPLAPTQLPSSSHVVVGVRDGGRREARRGGRGHLVGQ